MIRHIHGNAHIYADNTEEQLHGELHHHRQHARRSAAAELVAGIAVTNGSPTSNDTVNVCAKIGGSTAAEKNTLNLGGNLGIIVGASGLRQVTFKPAGPNHIH